MMPFGRDLQKSLATERIDTKDDPLPTDRKPKQTIANVIGLMGSMAVELILADIDKMLKNQKNDNLDGYIFALSRLLRHDLAWKCIIEAFAQNNRPIPARYYPSFGQQKGDNESRSKNITVS